VIPASPPEVDGSPRASRGSRIGRLLVGVAVAGMVAMWLYVLYLALGPGRQDPIDRLDDPAFARLAEPRCAEALATIADLPAPQESASPAQRSETVTAANATLAAMLEDLRAVTPTGEDGRYVREWLDDWRLYLSNREQYAESVRTDPDAGFLVSVKPGESRQVSIWIDEFAKANRMPSCQVPSDV
jgi:hypothetical protein